MSEGGSKGTKRGKKKKRGGKKASAEQALASKCVFDWAFASDSIAFALRSSGDSDGGDGFLPPGTAARREQRVVFELHAHSTRSDGFLSPVALVQRAHRNGAKPSMAKFPEASTDVERASSELDARAIM